MKTFLRLSICMAILALAFPGCNSDDDPIAGKGTNKLSPPSWIRGTWADEDGYLTFEFKSDDILMNGVSLKTLNASVPGVGKVSMKESKKTDTVYEITYIASDTKETETGRIGFKKGGSNFIYFGEADGKDPIDYDEDYPLYKK